MQQKARDEVLGVLGDSDTDIIPSVSQTKQMNYLNMVIKEVRSRAKKKKSIIFYTEIIVNLFINRH